jgi:hypothetical protein
MHIKYNYDYTCILGGDYLRDYMCSSLVADFFLYYFLSDFVHRILADLKMRNMSGKFVSPNYM